MTQSPHDQLSKQHLETFLEPIGAVQRQYEVPGEAKFIDVWFVPNPEAVVGPELGLLGQMVQTACLFEPYRNPPSRRDVRVAVMKLVWVQEDERRKAQVDELPEENQPQLWILAAKTSALLLRGAKAEPLPDWPVGVYFCGDVFKTAIVAIDQLPVTSETLLLRILGRGDTQKQAIQEVLALPEADPRRAPILRLLSAWRVRIDLGELINFAEPEELMEFSAAFLQWEQETEQRGKLEGKLEERRELAVKLLQEQVPVDVILKVTGFTSVQLQQMQVPR
jgi:hypothetical protein